MSSYLKRLAILICLVAAAISSAQINVFSNGTSGDFSPTQNTVIDLGLAQTGTWNQPSVGPNGVYDPVKWVVVYHYTNVNIPAGVTITFKNHPKNPPVVWLVSGNVTINGILSLRGQDAIAPGFSLPGPGGFRGGGADPNLPAYASGGFGPGGGTVSGTGLNNSGSHATVGIGASGPTYNNTKILPLIGGSGGTGWANVGGGGGGGAILIACNNTVAIGGTIQASGGGAAQGWQNGGSGGAVRIICDSLTGTSAAVILAQGGNTWTAGAPGYGRIRFEMNNSAFQGSSAGVATGALPDNPVMLFPPSTRPAVQIASVGGVAAPADPSANLALPDLSLNAAGTYDVLVQATNVPLNWHVQVRRVGARSPDSYADCTYVSGNSSSSVWKATMPFSADTHALIARAFAP